MTKSDKIKILWISMHSPMKTTATGGGQTFYYYFSNFLEDPAFDIRLISCSFYSEKETVEKGLSSVEHFTIFWHDPNDSKVKKLYNIESKLNIFNRHAQLISNSDAKKILNKAKEYRDKGWSCDIIILEWTNVVVLAKELKKLFPKAALVASEHDVTYIGYRRKAEFYKGLKGVLWKLKYNIEKKKELEALSLCNIVLPHNSGNKAQLIEDGIAEEKIHWLVPYYNDMSSCVRRSNHRDILFFGAMGRAENYLSAHWFIDNVMPLLTDLDIRFVILGGNPPESLRRLKSDKIIVTGFVDKTEPYFEQSMCMVAPLVLGAGIKIKILEALSAGIPVLTNSIGIEGIAAERGVDYIHCEKPEEYAEAIGSIYNDENNESYNESGAKAMIHKRYSYKNSLQKYKQMIFYITEENK